MNYAEFVDSVAERLNISPAQAETLTQATTQTLGERLTEAVLEPMGDNGVKRGERHRGNIKGSVILSAAKNLSFSIGGTIGTLAPLPIWDYILPRWSIRRIHGELP